MHAISVGAWRSMEDIAGAECSLVLEGGVLVLVSWRRSGGYRYGYHASIHPVEPNDLENS